jgi:uncharacterized protein (DUF2132 family)
MENSNPPAQTRNPLHSFTLEAMVSALHAHYGWTGLGERIALRCFISEPSVASIDVFIIHDITTDLPEPSKRR